VGGETGRFALCGRSLRSHFPAYPPPPPAGERGAKGEEKGTPYGESLPSVAQVAPAAARPSALNTIMAYAYTVTASNAAFRIR
jgi:hypothetical protein